MEVVLVLLGAALAVLGSFLAGRAELTRRQRTGLYDEIVPRLLTHLRSLPDPSFLREDTDQMIRAATIAGRRDRRHALFVASAVDDAIDARRAAWGPDRDQLDGPDPDLWPAFEDRLGVAIAATEKYEAWLVDRFVPVLLRRKRPSDQS